MKKFLAFILILSMASMMLVSCGSKEYTLGIGAAVTNDGTTKVETTVASVVLDADGKIVACRIDALDFNTVGDDEGNVSVEANFTTKRELGDDYGMVKYGVSDKEWYTQAEYFEGVVVGKTVAEVSGIWAQGDEELIAGCTIDAGGFVKAVVAACKSEHKVSFKSGADIKVGLSVIGSGESKDGAVTYAADTAATVVAGDKVVAAVIDSLEATVEIDDEANATGFTYKGTKLEQGDNYGMVAYAGAVAEWYAQAQAFANTAVGKAPADVANLATEGIAGCTIGVEGYHKALVKAVSYIR